MMTFEKFNKLIDAIIGCGVPEDDAIEIASAILDKYNIKPSESAEDMLGYFFEIAMMK